MIKINRLKLKNISCFGKEKEFNFDNNVVQLEDITNIGKSSLLKSLNTVINDVNLDSNDIVLLKTFNRKKDSIIVLELEYLSKSLKITKNLSTQEIKSNDNDLYDSFKSKIKNYKVCKYNNNINLEAKKMSEIKKDISYILSLNNEKIEKYKEDFKLENKISYNENQSEEINNSINQYEINKEDLSKDMNIYIELEEKIKEESKLIEELKLINKENIQDFEVSESNLEIKNKSIENLRNEISSLFKYIDNNNFDFYLTNSFNKLNENFSKKNNEYKNKFVEAIEFIENNLNVFSTYLKNEDIEGFISLILNEQNKIDIKKLSKISEINYESNFNIKFEELRLENKNLIKVLESFGNNFEKLIELNDFITSFKSSEIYEDLIDYVGEDDFVEIISTIDIYKKFKLKEIEQNDKKNEFFKENYIINMSKNIILEVNKYFNENNDIFNEEEYTLKIKEMYLLINEKSELLNIIGETEEILKEIKEKEKSLKVNKLKQKEIEEFHNYIENDNIFIEVLSQEINKISLIINELENTKEEIINNSITLKENLFVIENNINNVKENLESYFEEILNKNFQKFFNKTVVYSDNNNFLINSLPIEVCNKEEKFIYEMSLIELYNELLKNMIFEEQILLLDDVNIVLTNPQVKAEFKEYISSNYKNIFYV